MVRFGVDYLPVPNGMIEVLQAREDSETGYHRLTAPNLKEGDRVCMKSGAFAGIEGVLSVRCLG